MNFATLKGLTIPEGNVTQITDASGNVLWKKAPSTANVKLKVQNGGNFSGMTESPNVGVTIDEVPYNSAQELVVPVGTVIMCVCSAGNTNQIYLNGETVDTRKDAGRYIYDYTVTGDVEITMGGSMSMQGGGYGTPPTQVTSATIHIVEL